MQKRIKYTMPNSGVAIVIPAINIGEEITEDQSVERAMKRLPSDAVDPQIIDVKEVPTDRTFRDAWKPDFSVDMEKARDIHRQRLRIERVPLLAALDVAYQRADESGDAAAKKAIAERKQALRDVTADPAIEAASTPEELKIAAVAVLDDGQQVTKGLA